ncbi:MAG: DNA polymerase III subunit alpha [Firmicutes bacterium]|nr:DNA polymerase III subunit alpha [Bacillota bacterium]
MSFVHLRVHSEYSFLRGACRLENLVLQAKKLGMPAVALTDYGVLHGAVRFTALAKKYGLKPLLGAEVTVSGLPVVLLVRNQKGWRNLVRLVNLCQLQKRENTLDIGEITRHCEGLTVILHTQTARPAFAALAYLPLVQNVLTVLRPQCEKLYLALEMGGAATESLNRRLAQLADCLGIPLVATHNVHYVLPGDDLIYRLVNCIRTGKPLAGAEKLFLPDAFYYLVSPEKMRRYWATYPEACENTLKIAESCTFLLEREEMHLPHVALPEGEEPGAVLIRLCREGLRKKGLDSRQDARERLEKELAVILPKGLASYFLVVHDLVCYARRAGIPVGPGRGSAGGSLVAYLLGITQVDPLAHGLYFERFLSEDRAEFPDIDLDVCQRRRQELLDYLRSRYGEDRVAQVCAFSTLGARAAVREVGKVLDLTQQRIAELAEALPHYTGQGGIAAAVQQFPEFQQKTFRERAVKEVLVAARQLEGLCRHLSTHASGIIIGEKELHGNVPLCRGLSGEILTQWDKDDVEAMGFLKIDLLGSRNLTIIHDTLAFVEDRFGAAPGVEEIPLNDKKTFAMLRRGESLGCFQLESTGMRRVLRLLAPRCLEDLMRLLALYRPGPWESGVVETFVARLRGKEETVHIHPILAPILADTYGVILYQEQVMRIACEVGGYTPGEADCFRRDLAKRAQLDFHRRKFLHGAQARGLTRQEAGEIFDHLYHFTGYSFNKSHAAAYALISYWTAYLKAHYPVEFYAALLSTGFGYYGPVVYVHEARLKGIPVLPPHVNHSGVLFLPEEKGVRAALSLVRDLGTRGVAAILAARKNGPFISLRDFCRRLGRNTLRRSALVNLIKVGAFDGLGLNRRQALAMLDHILKGTARYPGQLSLWDDQIPVPKLPPYTVTEKAEAEANVLGVTLCCHPLENYLSHNAAACDLTPLAQLPYLPAKRTVTVAAMVLARVRRRLKKGDGVMLTLFLSDQSGFAEAVIYPAVYKRFLPFLKEKMLLLTGKTTADGDSLLVEEVLPLAMLPVKKEKKVAPSK